MKNQYFGDINDYRKYGLLRALQSQLQGRLLVAWMLTPDDDSTDGAMRAYLRQPERWRHHDATLYDGLVSLLGLTPLPEVSLIERTDLLPNASYYSALVPDSREDRDVWRGGLLDAARDVDLAFVDPDTGIEIRSKPVGRKHSSKYVTWWEVQSLWSIGCSVLVYQHFRREPRDAFARRLASELRGRTGARFVEAFRTPYVLFLLAVQNRHVERLAHMGPVLSRRWSGQIEPLGLAAKAL